MKHEIKRRAVRALIAITKAASHFLPQRNEFWPGEVRAIQETCEAQYFHFGIVDNPYREDSIQWPVWDRQAKRVIDRVKRLAGRKEERIAFTFEGEWECLSQ